MTDDMDYTDFANGETVYEPDNLKLARDINDALQS